jgi:hypothetical protein
MNTITKKYSKMCICGKGWNNGNKKEHLDSVYHILWVNREYKYDQLIKRFKYIVQNYNLYNIFRSKNQKTKSN